MCEGFVNKSTVGTCYSMFYVCKLKERRETVLHSKTIIIHLHVIPRMIFSILRCLFLPVHIPDHFLVYFLVPRVDDSHGLVLDLGFDSFEEAGEAAFDVVELSWGSFDFESFSSLIDCAVEGTMRS